MDPETNFNIHSLGKYMLTETRMREFACKQMNQKFNKTAPIVVAKSHVSNPTTQADVPFFPKEKDSLFWCFYIMKYGLDVYRDLGQINIVIEKKIKIEYIELLRKNKLVLKTNKMAPLAHIENALLNEFKIDIKTFLALCVAENMSVMYIHKNTFYELNIDTDENNIQTVVREDNPLRYGYEASKNNQTIRDTMFKIDNLSKPIKAMSSYKLDELVGFCEKLGIVLGEKPKKKDYYERLLQYLG